MKCPKCHAENPDDAQYCYLCYARFGMEVRSSRAEEEARLIKETHRGSMLRCPNCGEMSPLDSPFCMRCGFVFEELESIMVSEEEVRAILESREKARRREEEILHSDPLRVEPSTDGAEALRRLEDVLENGYIAHVEARGRVPIARAMKILALLGEEFRGRGKDVILRVRMAGEHPVTDLDDLHLEMEVRAVELSEGES